MTQIDRRQQFTELARNLSTRAKSQAAQPVVVAADHSILGHFAIDGVEFEASYPASDAPEPPDHFHLRCRFGKVPATGAASVYEQALKSNHVLARAHGSMMAVDARTGELVYSIHLGLAHTADAAALLKRLEEIAKGALAWRKLPAQKPVPLPASGPLAPVMPLEADTGKHLCPHREKLLALLRELPAQHDLKWREDKPLPAHVDSPRIAPALWFGAQKFTLVHSIEPSIAHLCLIECEFGSPGADHAEASYRRLLELNDEIAPLRTSGFSIDPVSGHVVHGFPMLLEHTTATSLARTMDMLAELALAWRHDQFLPGAPSARQPAEHGARVAR
jgi:hypothetical protein